MSCKRQVTIIGCGHGGQALAAHLSMKNGNVTLYADPNHQGGLAYIKEHGEIHCTGRLTGIAGIFCATSNIQKAVSTADIIFLSLPSYAHESMFSAMIPHLKDGQIICTLAANFASLCFSHQLARSHYKPKVTFVDFDSLPYACRSDNQGTVNILAIKKQLSVAVLPDTAARQAVKTLETFFPISLSVCSSVIKLGLNITSGISHPVTALLNAGRIGKEKDDFYFYKEGISETTAQLLARLDEERQYIGKLYGFSLPGYLDLMHSFYGKRHDSIYQFFRQTQAHNCEKLCPQSMNDRYIEQDVPFVLVPWYSLGKAVGYEPKIMRSIIDLSSLLNQKEYLDSGRNLEHLIPEVPALKVVDRAS